MKLHKELKAILQYHKGIGLDSYPLNDPVKKFLSDAVAGQLQEKSRQPVVTDKPPSASATPTNIDTSEQSSETIISLTDIHEEVQCCRACELHSQRIYPVPGRGDENARLLIVGDWLSSGKDVELVEGRVFGVEQDTMLSKMLGAINLDQKDVFVTNVVKCAVPHDCQPKAAHVKSCISYLRRQIVTIRPEVICSMGMVVSRALLEKSQPLSRLRGRFHEYHLDKRVIIPVLATYHPTYLLQNPEMKRATWEDLKLLGRRLGLRF